MSDGETRLRREDDVAHITFDRPAARNAMTWTMYEQLGEICAKLAVDRDVRVVVMRGAGGQSFIAGTDIAQFRSFKTGEEGLAYERKLERYLELIEALPMPTLAVVEGFAIGGGLAIASCCDLRIATPGSRFGVPTARTLGNCLSIQNYARLVVALGAARTKKVMLMAENLSAEEALAGGFILEIVQPGDVDRRVGEICTRLQSHAPITMRVTKEAMRRLMLAGLPNTDDLTVECYGSEDFKIGVESFVAKKTPQWTGS